MKNDIEIASTSSLYGDLRILFRTKDLITLYGYYIEYSDSGFELQVVYENEVFTASRVDNFLRPMVIKKPKMLFYMKELEKLFEIDIPMVDGGKGTRSRKTLNKKSPTIKRDWEYVEDEEVPKEFRRKTRPARMFTAEQANDIRDFLAMSKDIDRDILKVREKYNKDASRSTLYNILNGVYMDTRPIKD